MAIGYQGSVIGSVQRLFGAGTVAGLSETQLLDRFISSRDESAFEAIVQRHGPMVLGVCRRVLADPHDVDDAFQATFLILVKKAGSIRDRDVLATWLCGVARRVAVRSRINRRRRQAHERSGVDRIDAADLRTAQPEFSEIRSILDMELKCLPLKYRTPIVLCDLEGQTHEEAAVELRLPLGTIKSRLARGRKRLRSRLVRRGITSSAGVIGTILAAETASAVPVELMSLTIRAATSLVAGRAAMAGACSATTVALMEGVLRTMLISKLKVAGAALVVIGVAVAGSRLLLGREVGEPLPDKPAEKPAVVEKRSDGVERFMLGNGLSVMIRPIPGAEQTALVVAYSIGGDHDPEGKSGMGHMVEHLYVTAGAGDQEPRTSEEYARRYPAGANAQTGDRYTVIATVFPKADLDSEMKDAAARMGDLRITDIEVDRERSRIITEVGNMFSNFLPLAAVNNAREQARPTRNGGRRGGLDAHIKALTTEDVRAYAARYYKPCNAIISISGAIDPISTRKQLEAYFGKLPRGEKPPAPKEPGKPILGRSRAFFVKSEDADEKPQACLAYLAPQPDSDLYAPFLILISRLWESAGKLSGVGATGSPVYFTPLDDGGIVAVSLQAKDGDSAKESYARLETFIAETLAPKLRETEIETTKQLLGGFMGTAEVPDAVLVHNPYLVAFSQARREQMEINSAKLKRAIEAVTDADLRRVATEVFAPSRHAGAFVAPQK